MADYTWNDPREWGYLVIFKHPISNHIDETFVSYESMEKIRKKQDKNWILVCNKKYRIFENYDRAEIIIYQFSMDDYRKKFK